jgi:drug/metabolite transporter (DMT)-like permease
MITMESNRPSILKPAMTYGLIIALVYIILAVLVWIIGLEGKGWMQWVNWVAYFAVLYYCLKNWRDHYNGGYIRYGQSLSAGILFMFFASVIYAFYNVVYMTWIDPTSVERMLDIMEEEYYKRGLSEEQVTSMMEFGSKLRGPGMQFFSVIIGTTFIGVIISLIASIFIRKEGDPYQQAMSEIENSEKE